ncbi:Crp/Fnr family transcriptional regulator [Luteibacter sp. PPL201]|uniref:CRP-like protein Clp n=1 Tax=Luteibacter sahnii TaxID=3021977 RepID=A0ABT6BCB9_9GAMM|nr:Crp/Fnr family transcriptional regulator [Luteibacter sp. PPL193]MDY1547515.1 Crp/Fnr family transcriptional regulator [Luteibacter sp. PPL193]
MSHALSAAPRPPAWRPGSACNGSCRHASACEATRGGDPALLGVRGVVERVGPFSDGDRLVQPGSPHRGYFSVLSGMAKTTDANRVVAFHLPGELFALEPTRAQVHERSISAIGKTWFCRFPRDAMSDLCGDNDDIARHLAALRRREHRLLKASHDDGDALTRVSGFLFDLRCRRRHIEGESAFVPLPMSREDIGSYLGMSAATVTRMLGRLRAAGILTIRADGIDVSDEASLVPRQDSPGSKPSRSFIS